MKSQPIPTRENFDATKFKIRYNLKLDDIYIKQDRLYYPDFLPDNAADFGIPGSAARDAPDNLEKPSTDSINAVLNETATLTQIRKLLKYLIEKGIIKC